MLRTLPTRQTLAVFLLATAGAVGCGGGGGGNSGKASTVAPTTSQVTSSTPAFVSMTPTSGPANTPVTIICKNVSKSATVDFSGVPVVPAVTVANGLATIKATVPATAMTGAVHVKDGSTVLSAGIFTITSGTTPQPRPTGKPTPVPTGKPTPTPTVAPSPASSPTPAPSPTSVGPSVTSMSPTAGLVGDTVNITCKNLGTNVTVDFNGTIAANPTFHGLNGAVTVTVTVPSGATSGTVYVSSTVNGAVVAVAAGTFTVNSATNPAAPSVVSLKPATGPIGASVAIVCSGVSSQNLQVSFGNTAAVATINSSSTAAAVEVDTTVPAGATTGHVFVYDATAGVTLDAGVFTVGAAPAPGKVQIVSATIADANFDHIVSQGDTITVTFSAPVTVTATDPTGQIDLLVAGDSFGTGATMAAGAAPTDVVITLGQAPKLRVTGTYDATSTAAIKSSGLDVDATASGIAPATSGSTFAPSAAGIDLDSTDLVEGVHFAGVSLTYSRGLHSATLLDDGRVLVVGGITNDGNGSYYQSENEIYDPLTNLTTLVSDPTLGGVAGIMSHTSAATGQPFAIGRYAHVALKRPDGRVMIIGGHGIESHDATTDAPVYSELASVFVFDPTTNVFIETSPLATARRDAMGAVLGNGQVIVFGGRDANGTLKSSEIYDPATGSWTAGPDMVTDLYDSAVVGFSGGLFVGGGASQAGRQTANPTLTPATAEEMFDPAQNAFVAAPNLLYERRSATATLCDSGDFIVAGGTDPTGAQMDSCERYDAAQGYFVTAGALAQARARHAALAFESNVLVIGGMTQDAKSSVVTNVDTVEVLDQRSGTIKAYTFGESRLSATATLLQDGRVLVLGGFASNGGKDIRGIGGLSSPDAEVFVRP